MANIVSHTAQIEKDKAAARARAEAARARAEAEAERKRQAQADIEAKARAEAEAAAAAQKAEEDRLLAEAKKNKVANAKPAVKTTATTAKAPAKKGDGKKGDGKGTGSAASDVTVDLSETLADVIPNGGNYSYTPFTPIEAILPSLQNYDAATLAKLYGIDYNQENIYNTLMKGVDTAYKTKYTDQGVAENKYYANMATAQSALAEQNALTQSQAIMAGTNKGMQAAQALSSMLGVSQQAAAEATQLAVDRQKLSDAYSADQAKARADALNTYNAIGADFLEGGKSLYSSDVSKYVGQLDSRASTETNNATLAAQAMAGKSSWDNGLANILGSTYGQYMNNTSNENIADTNYAATKYATDNQQAYTGYTAPATTQTAPTAFDKNAFVSSVSMGESNGGMSYDQATKQLAGLVATGAVDASTQRALSTWLETYYAPKPKATPKPTNTGTIPEGINAADTLNPLLWN